MENKKKEITYKKIIIITNKPTATANDISKLKGNILSHENIKKNPGIS